MRHRRNRNIIIELTSLLDVIMIMIFMVMNENSKLIQEQRGTIDKVQQENTAQADQIDDLTIQLAEALAQLDEGDREVLLQKLHNAENQLESYQALDDVFTVLTVKLKGWPNSSRRTLTYGKGGDLQEHPTANEEGFQAAIRQLAVFIHDYTKLASNEGPDSPTVYIVFSYDPYEVRQSDVQSIEYQLNDNHAGVQYIVNEMHTN